jgi:hypothetical protein
MAKHTPFFKFDTASWLGGSIQFLDLQAKGLFIDLCAIYWDSEKPVKIDRKFKLRARLLEGDLSDLIGDLSDLEIIHETEHGITIPFLDELRKQRNEFLENCSKGGKNSTKNKGQSSIKKEERRKKREESRDKNKKVNQKIFTPPTLEEVASYCLERNNGVDSVKWHNFYSSKGWMIGKNKMKDWKAAVRTWETQKEAKKEYRL